MDRRKVLGLIGAGSAGLLLPAPALAAVSGTAYYVSGAGSDSNNGRSPETPFRTLRRAADLTSPGDTVYAMNGDYTSSHSDVLKIVRSGAAGSRITYRNYPGHKPRILVAANNWQGIAIFASYITIEGFEVAGNAANVTYDYALSQKDNLHNTATSANGIFSNGKNVGTLRNIIIRNNHVHHMPGGGIGAMATDYVTIADNTVHSCAWWSPYGNSGISVYTSRDVDANTKRYKTIVRRNVCYDNENYIPFHVTGEITDGNGIIIDDNKNTQHAGVAAYRGRTLVINNLCYDNGGTGMHTYSSARVSFVNNTAYFNNRSPALDNGEVNAKYANSVRLYNNILYARTGKKCQNAHSNVDVIYDHNIYFNGAASVRGFHDIIADPLFVNASLDPAAANFRSAAKSPAIGTGTPNLAPADDLVRNPRPSGLGFDRGAYQHG